MLHHDPQFATKSYYDRHFDLPAVKVLPGEYFASADGTGITTLLGSCVSVCLYEPESGIGGMNHFMLPELLRNLNMTRCNPASSNCGAPCSTRYGACAMRHLLQVLERLGAREDRLEAKVFGAGQVMTAKSDIGRKNAEFALGYLEERGIPVVASDLGDRYPRRIFFMPASGKVYVKRLTRKSIDLLEIPALWPEQDNDCRAAGGAG